MARSISYEEAKKRGNTVVLHPRNQYTDYTEAFISGYLPYSGWFVMGVCITMSGTIVSRLYGHDGFKGRRGYKTKKAATEFMQSLAEEPRLDAKMLDHLIDGYIEAALFCGVVENDDGSTPLLTRDNLSPDTLEKMVNDVRAFFSPHSVTSIIMDSPRVSLFDAGSDLWYSRNGHGTGFFDGNYASDEACKFLQEQAGALGQSYLYVGHDGKGYLA